MTQVLTLTAIATCAANGHRWHPVRTWHAVGYEECHVCGETRNQGFLFGSAAPAVVFDDGPREAPAPRPAGMPKTGNVAPGVRPSRKGRNGNTIFTKDEEAALFPQAFQFAKDARDRDILFRLSQGQTLGSVAALYHVSESRTHQIKKKALLAAVALRGGTS